jgi:putative ABC transport system permease protein
MLKNYIKIAWRNLWKHKIFSLINILGLSAGIAFTLLISAYIREGLQVNHGLKNADNQYIILSKWKDPNIGNETGSVPDLTKTLKTNYPGLVANYYNAAVAMTNVSKGNMHFREGLLVGDSTFLHMYGFKLLDGDAKTALQGPYSVVITGEIAKKYFGRTDVVGQSLSFEDYAGGKHDYMITGVLDELPENTITNLIGRDNLQFFINGSINKLFRNINGWDNTGATGYIELQKGADPKVAEKALLELLQKNETDEEIKNNLIPYLAPLKSYYLEANNGLVKKMIWTLSCIAFIILVTAVINFVNICIGRSWARMKEMGIRKVLGGLRHQLTWQFLTESVLMVLLATVVALCIYPLASQYLSIALGHKITGLTNFPVYFIIFPLLFALLVGLLAGIYPALVLSALGTIDSVKGKLNSIKESIWLRKTLVAFQFLTATIVFIGAIIISQQVSLFFHGNLGYNKDYVIYAPVPRDWSPKGVQKMEAMRSQLAQMPQVSSVSLSWEVPAVLDWEARKTAIYRQGANPSQGINTLNLLADNQYAATFNIPLKAGSFFDAIYLERDFPQVVINLTELKALGWSDPNEAIGQKLVYQGSPFIICGVTADFHFGSMQQRIQPVTFTNVNDANIYRYFSVKLKAGNMQASIGALQNKWNALMPGAPFEYRFLDDALKSLYATELQLKEAAYIATVLAFIIVLLGVLGMISLSIQKRTKEIGIRKILGSSIAAIISLFLKDFLGVIAIAGVMACPLAYLIMQHWLNDYAYHITISWVPFAGSLILLTFLTTVLIILQTVKVAIASPIKSVKND